MGTPVGWGYTGLAQGWHGMCVQFFFSGRGGVVDFPFFSQLISRYSPFGFSILSLCLCFACIF